MKILLQINGLCKNYGPRVILEDASVAFGEDQKIGVIGRNGAGKSTLCRIITEHEEADDGTVSRSADLRLSYLEQHDPYELDELVINFLMRYTGKQEWQCGKIAGKFQLKTDILNSTIGSLSGGFRTRVKLTAMLLRDPNFLILDEPTNYLDLKTLILLEEFLRDYRGGFLIVSHDREFLKKTCDHTLEVENGNCVLYPGDVEDYLIFKEEQKSQAESYNKNIEAKQKHLQSFVDRFAAKASKATQAKSKLKQIQKLKTIDIDHPLSNVKIRIPTVPPKKGLALSCEELTIGYPEKIVAKDINLEIQQGSHVAILGDNGQGKTTFLKTIANDLTLKGGKFRWGHNLKIGYYAQHVFSALNPDDDVYTYLASVAAPGVTSQEILNLAGSLLFKGDDVKKKASVLSGGEKARLCLAGLLLMKCSVLMLDEPTNHLDFETVEALGHALRSFGGTIFFISHDRTFVNIVASEIVEVNNGQVRKYHGPYEDYVYHLENSIRAELVESQSHKKQEPSKKESGLDKFALTKQTTRIETDIAKYKKELEEIHERFIGESSEPWTEAVHERYMELNGMIQTQEELWLKLTEELENL